MDAEGAGMDAGPQEAGALEAGEFVQELPAFVQELPIVRKLLDRLEEYDLLQKELSGFLYVASKTQGKGPNELPHLIISSNTPHPNKKKVQIQWCFKVCVEMDTQLDEDLVMTPHSDGYLPTPWFFVTLRKMRDGWSLQRNRLLDRTSIEITVKHVGSEDWVPVQLLQWTELGHDNYSATNFKNGDELNIRYVHDGVSYPLSPDGTEEGNYFPLIIRTIR